ncbi:MAG: integrase, partial [bacterium]|nr:integrase [bacterium]
MSWSPCFSRSVSPGGRVQVRLGHELVDDYLEFVAARSRPNTVLAAG